MCLLSCKRSPVVAVGAPAFKGSAFKASAFFRLCCSSCGFLPLGPFHSLAWAPILAITPRSGHQARGRGKGRKAPRPCTGCFERVSLDSPPNKTCFLSARSLGEVMHLAWLTTTFSDQKRALAGRKKARKHTGQATSDLCHTESLVGKSKTNA